jgi:hypothetical protein
LQERFKHWSNASEMVSRALAPYERDLQDLRQWKKEALASAEQSRKSIQERQAADQRAPLIASMTARWTSARDLHDIELGWNAGPPCRGSTSSTARRAPRRTRAR